MRRRAWFDWHSWVGLNLSLLMAFVVCTGTLATVSRELDWLSQPAMRAASVTDEMSWGTMLANFKREFPDAQARRIDRFPERWVAPQLVAVDAAGERFRVFFDPASGEVQGTAGWFNWQRFLREAHRHLMLPLEVGLVIVGLLSLPLLVSFLSSLYVYKRWWRGFFRLPRGGATADGKTRRRFWGDVHRLAGVWSLWFVLLMAVTGAWYLVEYLGLRATPPALEQAATQADTRLLETDPRALDAMVSQAKARYPTLDIRRVIADANGAVLLQGQADAVLVRTRANHVAFDANTGELLDIRRGETLDLHNRIAEAADPLHFGDFGGPATRYLWALFGVAMTALSVTGVYLFGLRTLAALRNLTAGTGGAWGAATKRIPGRYLWPQAIVVLVCLGVAGLRALLP